VTTDGFGNASLSSSFPLQTCGAFVTATATKRVAGETSEFSACIPVVNTPAGAVVVVEPHQGGSCLAPVTVTFDNVTGAGFTSYTNSDSCPDVTGAFIQADSVDCYVIETTASFTKTIQFCVEYNVSDLLVSESDLLLLHYDSVLGDWTDVTTSIDSLNNMIYGEAEELGAFRMGAANPLSGVAGGAALPTRPALYQNVPNPFNPVTSVPYDVPIGGAYVSIRVYDVAGRFVRTLVDAHESAGRKHVIWDGRNHSGQHLATGVYFCRFRTGDFVQTRKLLLLK